MGLLAVVKSNSTAHGERVRADILRTGLDLWREGGATALSARAIGRVLGLTHAGVLYHFEGHGVLRNAIASYAVETGDETVIPQLIVAAHPAIAHLTVETRRHYLSKSAGC